MGLALAGDWGQVVLVLKGGHVLLLLLCDLEHS
jgi:hypothetical protein